MKNFTNYFTLITNLFLGFFGRTLTIMSTFNGIGAASESLKQLGVNFEMDTICEIDKDANNTYYANNKRTNHVDDINVLLQTVEKGKKLDVLVQTPPCQSFSMAGKRAGLESNNGNLFLTAINLQKKVDANVVIYENVKGLISHDKKVKSYASQINKDYDCKKKSIGHTLHTIETLLLQDKRYNYYWKVINSSDQGLPQNRERIFIVGIKKELDKGFTFPSNKPLAFNVSDILEKEPANNVFYENKANHKLIPTNQKRREGKIHTLAKYSETMTFESTRRVYAPYVAACITTGNNSKFMIDGKVRTLTPLENKRIHGFREEFEFVGLTTKQNKQLGNTVSPGVYASLFTSLFNSLKVESVNNEDYNSTKTQTSTFKLNTKKSKIKRGRPLKKTVVSNNHINIDKKITNTPDLEYLNLTESRFNEYKSHLDNGGTISMTVEFYKNTIDKKNGKIKEKLVISIYDLQMLGFRDKKNGIRRVKITSKSTNKVQKVAKSNVLFTRPGGKGKFEKQFDKVHAHLGLTPTSKKLDTVIDGFFGGGGYTLKNIDKLNFNRYIINDLDSLITKTMEGVKKDPSKVIELYNELNNEYQSIIPDELRNYKKKKGRGDKKLKALREKHIFVREFYQDLLSKLDNHNDLDIYTVSSIYIFVAQKTTSGFFKYYKNGIISKVNFNWHFTLNDKTKMIKHWSYLLNTHNVEIKNEDIFTLLEDETINKSNSMIYLDPPYVGVKYTYSNNVTEDFQIKLLRDSKEFKYRIYSNEDCKELYELNIHKNFPFILNFDRNNKMGQPTKTNGGFEFLACNTSEDVLLNSLNNEDYMSLEKVA